MDKKADDKKADVFTLPEGRVIHHNLFVKDAYNERATPAYKLELAFDKDEPAMAELEDKLLDFAVDMWGVGADEHEYLVLPIIDGDKLAKKREKKGKDGSAYAGKYVIRASTTFNKDGGDGPGGVQVLDPDVEEIVPARSGDVYPGCFGQVAVTIGSYQGNDGGPDKDEEFNGLKFYLAAFQKTRDGERLVTGSDRSSLFKPVDRSSDEGTKRRRRAAR